jgi:hypothetical protein
MQQCQIVFGEDRKGDQNSRQASHATHKKFLHYCNAGHPTPNLPEDSQP